MESIPGWQLLFLGGIVSWILISSMLDVAQKIRSLTQPWVSRHVISGAPMILQIQRYQHGLLDAFFSGLSCVVSVPFYTTFLPLLFWVAGVQQTYHQFHHESVPRIFTPQLTITAFAGRMLVGIPTILLVKFCSKALAKWILPISANALGIPIRSTSYIPALIGSPTSKKSDDAKQSGYFQKLLFFTRQDTFDVDTGIRLLQYAGLAWSVVDLVPSLFSHLSL
ncbi:hypothetical protein RJ640_029336 [Escallonia rubra]|uniref:Uncharacterized protein n=1 Tax=Escallonia rubra TaxID=112253 RepID=A0AA88UHQ1_9ASTE|nr:hypothetical protein RJ640_029336 [Escallonia rubra]